MGSTSSFGCGFTGFPLRILLVTLSLKNGSSSSSEDSSSSEKEI
jgi:hypothetical protein